MSEEPTKNCIKLTDEQKDAIKSLIKLEKQVQTLGGYAGTGKTVVAFNLRQVLPDFAVCAYTGKAADVLRKKGILDAATIHKIIYRPVLDELGNVIDFTLKSNDEVGCSGFLVDEGSMVTEEMDGDLRSFGLPIIYIGDHGQLEPIGKSSFNIMSNPDYKLEQIHRNAGDIAYFAEYIRKGNKPSTYPSNDKVRIVNNHRASKDICDVDQIICAFNKTRVSLNMQVREKLGFTNELPQPGDRVMCLRNNYQAQLFNGMQGICKEVYHKGYGPHRMIFEVDGEERDVAFDKSQFNKEKYDFSYNREDPDPFDFCYAITCHKAQGSEWDRVMVFEQFCRGWDMKRWSYTAASRAKKQVMWVD